MAGGGERQQGPGRGGGGSILFRRTHSISSADLSGVDQESTALGGGDGCLNLLKICPQLFVFPYYGKESKAFTNFPKALRK